MGWLAADFEADVADGLFVGEKGWLAADFVTDLADGFLVGEKGLVGCFFQSCRGNSIRAITFNKKHKCFCPNALPPPHV